MLDAVVVDDPFSLSRFVRAQDAHGTFEQAVQELREGRKRSHWMWFVFPQLEGLGRSPAAQLYAVSGLAEARAYLDHPVLGPRLHEAVQALLDLDAADPVAVLGGIDAVKLRSSMTLFEAAAPEEPAFGQVLDRYYRGERDEQTLTGLRGPGRG